MENGQNSLSSDTEVLRQEWAMWAVSIMKLTYQETSCAPWSEGFPVENGWFSTEDSSFRLHFIWTTLWPLQRRTETGSLAGSARRWKAPLRALHRHAEKHLERSSWRAGSKELPPIPPVHQQETEWHSVDGIRWMAFSECQGYNSLPALGELVKLMLIPKLTKKQRESWTRWFGKDQIWSRRLTFGTGRSIHGVHRLSSCLNEDRREKQVGVLCPVNFRRKIGSNESLAHEHSDGDQTAKRFH